MGDTRTMDWLAQQGPGEADPHPLQEQLEHLIEDTLSEKEKMVFYMRFGERAPHREIAERMGYKSHYVVQWMEENIIRKIGEALEPFLS